MDKPKTGDSINYTQILACHRDVSKRCNTSRQCIYSERKGKWGSE